MVQGIDPIRADLRLAQLLGEDPLMAPATAAPAGPPAAPARTAGLTGNLFEDMLSKAVESLEGVSRSEVYADQLVEKYIKGEVELQDVMVAQAKMSIMVQLAVTTVNAAVNSFKEVTQIQV